MTGHANANANAKSNQQQAERKMAAGQQLLLHHNEAAETHQKREEESEGNDDQNVQELDCATVRFIISKQISSMWPRVKDEEDNPHHKSASASAAAK